MTSMSNASDVNVTTTGVNNGIGWAVKQLLYGCCVRRRGWNGTGMWLRLYHPYGDREFSVTHIGPGYNSGTLMPWVGMHTTDNSFVPWLCSQSDLLAFDWEFAD